jgi:hypothetical protein
MPTIPSAALVGIYDYPLRLFIRSDFHPRLLRRFRPQRPRDRLARSRFFGCPTMRHKQTKSPKNFMAVEQDDHVCYLRILVDEN